MASAPPHDVFDKDVSPHDFFKQRFYMYITRSPDDPPLTIEEIANALNITVDRAKQLEEQARDIEIAEEHRKFLNTDGELLKGGKSRKSRRHGKKSRRHGKKSRR